MDHITLALPCQQLFSILPDGQLYLGYGAESQPLNLHDGKYTTGVATKTKGKVDKQGVLDYIKNPTSGKIKGFGFCVGKEQRILVIDLDGCIDGDGKMQQWAKVMVNAFDSLTVISPSGTGAHVFLKDFYPDYEINRSVKLNVTACSSKDPGVEVWNLNKYIRLGSEIYDGKTDLKSFNLGVYNGAFFRISKMQIPESEVSEISKINNDLKSIDEETVKKQLSALGKSAKEHKEAFIDELVYNAPIIKDMLKFIPSESYDTWFKVACALKHSSSTLGESKAFEVLDEWSRTTQSGNYDQAKNLKLFARLEEDKVGSRAITIATVRYLAMEGGWKPPIPEWLNKMNENAVLVRDQSRLMYGHKDQKGEWRFLMRNDWEVLMLKYGAKVEFGIGGKPKATPKHKLWLQSPYRRECSSGFQFLPERLAEEGYFNTWEGWGTDFTQGEWKHTQKFLFDVICDQNMDVYQYLINWCAHLVQKPYEKPRVAVVMRGDKRIGKGFFVENILKKLVKTKNYLNTTRDALVRDFNSHLQNSLIIFADEYVWPKGSAKQRKDDAALRSVISEGTLFVTPKFQEGRNIDTVGRIVIATNERYVGDLSQGEKRFFIFDVSNSRTDDRKYFTDLEGHIKKELPHFWYDMKKLDIKGFKLENIPKTEAYIDQIEGNLPSSLEWIQSCVESQSIIAGMPWPKAMEADMFYQQYLNWSKHKPGFENESPLSRRGFKRELIDKISDDSIKREHVHSDRLAEHCRGGKEGEMTVYMLGSISNMQKGIQEWLTL